MNPINEIPDKAELLDNIWSELSRASKTRHHAWHLMQFSTVHALAPKARTVVIRDVKPSESLLVFHTDIRSPKVSQIQANPNVCWHAYDPECRVQIRLSGTATINHQDEYSDERWNLSSLNSRLCYANANAPSSVLEDFSSLENNSVSKADFDESLAKENFAVVTTCVTSIEWVNLKYQGHLRLRFILKNGEWSGSWLAP